jgi:hypothetical protein
MPKCLKCQKRDQETPLLQMWFQSREVYICPHCLPELIHKPAAFAQELPGVEKIEPPKHEHE